MSETEGSVPPPIPEKTPDTQPKKPPRWAFADNRLADFLAAMKGHGSQGTLTTKQPIPPTYRSESSGPPPPFTDTKLK